MLFKNAFDMKKSIKIIFDGFDMLISKIKIKSKNK